VGSFESRRRPLLPITTGEMLTTDFSKTRLSGIA
jgi:hypothetical protein